MSDFQDKCAIITGASRGIGAATALDLAKRGVNVVLAARSVNQTQALAEQIKSDGGKALALVCDVSRYSNLETTVDAAIKEFGRVDILVNNAGTVDPIARLADSDPALWGQVVDINLKGVYHGIRAVLPVMEKQGSGIIINLSSGAATNALEGWSHYCSTKAAVLSLTKCVHKEYAERGIRCIGLSPGTVATDMQVSIKKSGINPVSQMEFSQHIAPDWPARAVAFLCTDAAAEFSGTDFSIKTEEGRKLVGLI
ncbi:MAG: SDR family oxidoreductase [Granulosicoccus sp.]|nr:SDR family oxidoreductase [Granulosicoccus sp.]